ncbi:hypothetical protein [Enterococcus cecorum]|uniref:hypothetical protein n=1 Tax=Enterococcus cecorum TaxID=44008 RepID=UPI002009FEB7|nr:hypothetical protein [Enterococcus cecorum]MDZ5585316.1 hypothetical protein [Enterococcus cecorum]
MTYKKFDDYLHTCERYIKSSIDGHIYCYSYYMSSMEGLGTNFSDIDIYVIYDGKITSKTSQKRKICTVDMFKIDNQEVDIEFYSLNEFNLILEKIRNYSLDSVNHNVFDINIDLFKFIHKFKISKILFQEIDFNDVYKLDQINELSNAIISRNYYDLYRGDLDDGLKFYKDMRYVEAFYLLQKAFVNLSFALFSKYNMTTTKGKWFIKRIFQLSEMGNTSLEDFLKTYYFCKYKEINNELIEKMIATLRIISLEVL